MIEVIESRRAELADLCVRHHVKRLEVFGSAARGEDFDAARSDLDFLVEFVDNPPCQGLDLYFGLKDELEELFGRSVDLVMPVAVENRYLRKAIDRDRTLVYAA
ncbi:MAG: hypothetical protein BIFFINMI_03723 [Phycisphaerae bacterium]|nr:hypothetical protein [Phycisphaerae bacterium]